MADGKGVPKGLDPLQDVQEPVKLEHGVFLAAVGVGEMGENPLGVEAGQFHCLGDLLGGLLHGILMAKEAQAGHAGVTLNMDGQGASRLLYLGREGLGVVQVVAGLGNVIPHQLGSVGRRGAA